MARGVGVGEETEGELAGKEANEHAEVGEAATAGGEGVNGLKGGAEGSKEYVEVRV